MADKFDYSMGRLMSLKQRLIQNREKSKNALIQARQSQNFTQNRAALKKYFEHNKPMSRINSPTPRKSKYQHKPLILVSQATEKEQQSMGCQADFFVSGTQSYYSPSPLPSPLMKNSRLSVLDENSPRDFGLLRGNAEESETEELMVRHS